LKKRAAFYAKGAMARGQASAFDALVAFMLFMITLNLYTSIRQDYASGYSYGFEQLFVQDQQVAYQLVATPGYPSGWNQTDFVQLGLALKPGVIDPARFSALQNANYTQVETSLGVSGLGLQVTLVNVTNGTTIGSLNAPPISANATYVIPYAIPVLYNNTVCSLTVTTWI
jgi:hypothetical protein